MTNKGCPSMPAGFSCFPVGAAALGGPRAGEPGPYTGGRGLVVGAAVPSGPFMGIPALRGRDAPLGPHFFFAKEMGERTRIRGCTPLCIPPLAL